MIDNNRIPIFNTFHFVCVIERHHVSIFFARLWSVRILYLYSVTQTRFAQTSKYYLCLQTRSVYIGIHEPKKCIGTVKYGFNQLLIKIGYILLLKTNFSLFSSSSNDACCQYFLVSNPLNNQSDFLNFSDVAILSMLN